MNSQPTTQSTRVLEGLQTNYGNRDVYPGTFEEVCELIKSARPLLPEGARTTSRVAVTRRE